MRVLITYMNLLLLSLNLDFPFGIRERLACTFGLLDIIFSPFNDA